MYSPKEMDLQNLSSSSIMVDHFPLITHKDNYCKWAGLRPGDK